MSAISKGPDGKIAMSHQNPRKWPEWSLPPPEESVKKETAVYSVATCDIDHNSALEAATESGFFSAEGTNKMPSNSKSLSHDVENGTGQCENAAVAETPASSLQADSKQQSHETPSRPTSPEAHAPHSSHDSLVTGQWRSCQIYTAVAGTHPSENEEQDGQETGNPAEQYDDSENNGLLTELQKVILLDQMYEAYLEFSEGLGLGSLRKSPFHGSHCFLSDDLHLIVIIK